MPVMSSSCRSYNNHVKATQDHDHRVWPLFMISKGNHVKFARFVVLAVSEEAKTWLCFVQCIIKQLLDSVFVRPHPILVDYVKRVLYPTWVTIFKRSILPVIRSSLVLFTLIGSLFCLATFCSVENPELTRAEKSLTKCCYITVLDIMYFLKANSFLEWNAQKQTSQEWQRT